MASRDLDFQIRLRKMSILTAAVWVVACLSALVPTSAEPALAQGAPLPAGYVLAASDSGVFSFGSASFAGSMAGRPLNAPIVALSETPDGGGYWLVGQDRGVFAFGDAPFEGSRNDTSFPPCSPSIGCAARPIIPVDSNPAVAFFSTGPNSYRIAMSDGTTYPYAGQSITQPSAGNGGSPYPGLVAPIVGTAYASATSTLWEAGADGGVFSDPSSSFHGSMAGSHLAAPIVGIVASRDGNGYWLVGADGGVFAFGDALFLGSLPSMGIQPASRIVGMAATADGNGYWLVGADGGVFAFGDAPYLGGMSGSALNRPIIGIASP
jgi:hypothetical protein